MDQTVPLEVSPAGAHCRRAEHMLGLCVVGMGVFVIVSALATRVFEWRADRHAARAARVQRAAMETLVSRTASRVGVDRALAVAVARAESAFDPNARSSRGALGLMQVMPATGREMAKMMEMRHWDLRDPADNALLGLTYLRLLLRRYGGSRELALAAYHAGPERVDGWVKMGQGLPGELVIETFAFPMTRAYVTRVLQRA